MLSFDPLHVNDIGNWGTHFFEELKIRVKALGREAEAKIDEQYVSSLLCALYLYQDSAGSTHFRDGVI